jgi:hypothetical protein
MIVKVEFAVALVGGTLGASILASLLHYRAMQHSANDTLFANNVSLLFRHVNSKLTGYHIVLGTLKLSMKYTRAVTTCIGTIHCHSIWQCAKMQEGDAPIIMESCSG